MFYVDWWESVWEMRRGKALCSFSVTRSANTIKQTPVFNHLNGIQKLESVQPRTHTSLCDTNITYHTSKFLRIIIIFIIVNFLIIMIIMIIIKPITPVQRLPSKLRDYL